MKTSFFLEVGNLGGLVVMLVLLMLGPPILLLIGGLVARKTNKKVAKVLFILAGVYLIVGLGICGGANGWFLNPVSFLYPLRFFIVLYLFISKAIAQVE